MMKVRTVNPKTDKIPVNISTILIYLRPIKLRIKRRIIIINHKTNSLVDEQDSPIIHPRIAPINIAKGLNSTNSESLPDYHRHIDHKYTSADA